MVSQNQDAEWSDHPPVRSGSMLSLDGRQRPQVARTPPSYYDAVRSRHSLSHPVGRQQEPSKQDKQYFPSHEKYNSLPRPLPQRYVVAMTNGHDKFQAPHGSPWPGSPPLPQNTNGGWNPVLTDGVGPCLPRSERPPRPQQETPHEYRSPPGPANPVPQVHLPSRSREAPTSHLSGGVFPGHYNNSGNQHEQPASPPCKHSSAPVDDGQQYGSHFGDVRSPAHHFSVQNSPHRRHPPTGPRQHPPPPPIPSQQGQHPPIQPQILASPTNGTLEMRRPNPDRRDTDGSMHNGRWMRRSYPSTSEDLSAQDMQYSRSHSQELSQSHIQNYDPRYSRSGTLPARPRSHGAEIVLPAPAVSVRTGPLGTYPESRPTHMDHLPPPSSPQPSSLPEMSNGLSPRDRNGTKQPRSPYSEKEGLSKGLESKGHQHQPSLMTLNDALLYPNGLSLRKSMSSSTASLCSEASSASSRAWRTQGRSNGDSPIKRLPLNSRNKGAINEAHAHGKKDKDSVASPSPWAREEKEKLQKRQVQDARRARDEEIEYLETLPDRTHKQDEILRILRLEREFQKRAEEVANGDDDEDDEEDEVLDRAEHMERMLRMQEETARSHSKLQGNSTESHQHIAANSSDDWLARRKMNHLSRITEENGDFHRDLHIQNVADVEQLSEFLDNLSMRTNWQDSPPKKQDFLDLDHRRTNEEIHTESVNGYNGQQDSKMCNPNNVLNGNNDRTLSFPVPAPRTSKTHVPPPVPPKQKTHNDSNGYVKTDEHTSSPESILTTGFVVKEVRQSSKMESSTPGLQEVSVSQWIMEPKSPVSQTLHNGFDSNTTVNGLVKAERVCEVDIANLYASSKMRNGFTDSRGELEKFPELQKLWTSRPEKLTFQDKIRKFSLQAGEEEVPKDKVKNSRAQREIEIKFNEGLSKNSTQET